MIARPSSSGRMLAILSSSFRDTNSGIATTAHQQPRLLLRRQPIASLIAFYYILICLLAPVSEVSSLSCKSTTLKGLKCLTDQFSIIATPNFPQRFDTPYVMEWIIDAYGGQPTPPEKPHIIYLYLNQMYLKTNFTVTASTYSPYDGSDELLQLQPPAPIIRSSTTSRAPTLQQRAADSRDEDVKVTYFDPANDTGAIDDQYYYIYDDDMLPPQQQQQQQQQQRNSRSSITDNSIRPAMEQQNVIVKDGLRPQSLIKSTSHLKTTLQLPFDYNKKDNSTQLMVGPLDCGRLPKPHRPFVHPLMREDDLRELGLIFTTCRYLSIKVELYSPYTSHFRVRDHLLDVYGFNISYSVVDIEEPPSPNRCSASNCTYNGHCFLSHDYKNFACHCHEGSEGRNCEYDEFKCNPPKNITFCQHGAECRLLGASHGVCYCSPEYGGQLCEIKKSNYTGKVCPGRRQCQKQCDEAAKPVSNMSDPDIYARRVREHYRERMSTTKTEMSSSPFPPTTMMTPTSSSCSCDPPPNRPASWVLYEAILQARPNHEFPNWELKPTSRYKKNKSSLSYAEKQLKRRIETELIRRLDNLYSQDPPLETVTITSFSSQSQFSFKFFGPRHISLDVEETLANITASGQLLPDLALEKSFAPRIVLIPQIRITNLTVNERLPLQLSHGYSLTCTAEGSEYRSFKWFKDGIEINETLALRTVEKFPITKQGFNTFTTHLHIDHSATADNGVFTCQVSDFGNQETCGDLSISVITQPIIEILPRSLTLVQGDNGTILCAAAVESPQLYTYTWYKNRQVIGDGSSSYGQIIHEVTEAVRPYGLLLRIVNATGSATFTCKIVNPVGTATDEVYVHVLPSRSAPSCRAEIDKYNLKWNLTGLNQTARTFCAKNYTGFAQRVCHDVDDKPAWGSANFSRCISSELRKIYLTLKKFVAGFSPVDKFKIIIDALNQHINGKTSLYPGEGEKILIVLSEIGSYAAQKYSALTQLNIPPMLFQITSSLLKFPGSCVEKKSILNLIKLIHRISEVSFEFSESSNANTLFQNEVLVIDQVQEWNANDSQLFPKTGNDSRYPSWLNVQLHLDSNTTDSNGTIRVPIFISVFRNVTELLGSTAPTLHHFPYSHHFRRKREFPITDSWPRGPSPSAPQYLSSQIGSPIFCFSTTYMPKTTAHYFLTFTLSSELSTAVQRRRKKVICGSLDDDLYNFDNSGDVSSYWIKDNHQCTLARVAGNIVHCRCDRPGQYALLIHNFEPGEELPEPGIHWFIFVGSTICILCCAFSFVAILGHLHCYIGTNSIYILKVIACLSLIAGILLALPLRTTESSLVLSTCLCTTLILSVCCQLVKTLHVLLTINHDLFPRLRHFSTFNFVLLTTFTCSMPVWISAALQIGTKSSSPPISNSLTSEPVSVYDYNYSSELENSVLKGESPVFISFVATLIALMFVMLITYYKASLELRRCAKTDASKSQLFDQRLKSLNRAVLISIGIINMVTAVILHDWAPESVPYQYFYGFSTLFLGLVVLFCYTIFSEYPIPKWLVPHLICLDPKENLDLDKAYMSMNGTNNGTRSRTPQQNKIFLTAEGCELTPKGLMQQNHIGRHDCDEEELDDMRPRHIPPRCRNNTFSSQNSSEVETLETYGGSSLVSNNGLSMQVHHSNGRINSISQNSVKRANSISSTKRASVSSVQFNIPRSMTNPQTSSNHTSAHCFPSIVGTGRMKNSASNNTATTTASSSCSCGNCPQSSSNGQFWNGMGHHRQRSNSNNSMASMFGSKNSGKYDGIKPERGVCHLIYDSKDTASYVPPSSNSTCSFPSRANSMHRPSGPISFVNSSVIRISPPQGRRKEEYPQYVAANPAVTLPLPISTSSSAMCTSLAVHPEMSASSSMASFTGQAMAGGSSSNCSTNGSSGTLTNETNSQQLREFGCHFDYSKRQIDTLNPYPRNGFNRQLPSVPPYSSTSVTAAKHIYAEPNLQAIAEQQRRSDSASPVVSTDSQETDKSIYATTSPSIVAPKQVAASNDEMHESVTACATAAEPHANHDPVSSSLSIISSSNSHPSSYHRAIANGIVKTQTDNGNNLNYMRSQHSDYAPMGGVH